jgi:hypothetical protein
MMSLSRTIIHRHEGGISQVSINRSARAFPVSTTDRNLTAHAGAVLIRAAAQAVGLGTSVAAHLNLKKRAASGSSP